MTEQVRLTATSGRGLLESQLDSRFDRLTRLAANTLGTRSAIVFLTDGERHWLKSCHGIDTAAFSRAPPVCECANRGGDIMVVPDARKDARFADHPMIAGPPFVRFFALAPLLFGADRPRGALCVFDTEPRPGFTAIEELILSDLATGVTTEIAADLSARQVEDLGVINRELEHRMGNMYAHVSSLVSLLDKSEPERDAFVRRLREKIYALAKAQSLLAVNQWKSVSLRQLAVSSLSAFEPEPHSQAITVQDSDDFHIKPRAAFAMSLLLNELGTNALKHGALRSSAGRARFSWTQGKTMSFNWEETIHAPVGLPAVPVQPREGFGSMILNRIVPATFGGKSQFDLRPTGLVYSVSANRDRVKLSA